jgi:UDP-N-acetylmuramoyl-L-alanyl-D-glutamate--2,6-diaminopimelate ligase
LKLSDLIPGAPETGITGFVIDDRKVAEGTIFGAFPGSRFNGEDFIAKAVASGAIAVVARAEAKVEGAFHIVSENPRQRFAELAAQYFAPFPETLAAVTGTNGKTSTVELARQIWRMLGLHSASIGTLGITTADEQVVTGLTTPDVATFLSNLAGLKREGVSHVAFEASSHGLDQYRVGGIKVKAAAFTNLSRDHLDYHGTMEEYFAAKMRIFSELLADDGMAVIWADDEWSDQAIAFAKGQGRKVFAVGQKGEHLKLVERSITHLGQTLIVEAEGKAHKISLPLIGAYQVANALTAAGLVIGGGADVASTLAAMARVQGVKGRLERAVITKSGAPVYVDYAHTPDALEAAISALRPHTEGRIILVFGAGGDRDTGKRPLMGEVAARDADVAIITDDNPRSEDPESIRAAIAAAAPNAMNIGDRRSAIAAAVGEAKAGDIVLVAGKGHETGQEINGIKLPFSDVEVAREVAA